MSFPDGGKVTLKPGQAAGCATNLWVARTNRVHEPPEFFLLSECELSIQEMLQKQGGANSYPQICRTPQAALITGGSFYKLGNNGDGPMIMMGNRSGPAEKIQIIDYVTRKDSRQKVQTDFANG